MSLPYKSSRARLHRHVTYTRQDVMRDGPLSRKTPLRCFWWDMHPNFGDEFTPFLLPRYGFMPLLRPPQNASFFGVGSVLDMSPHTTTATFWGSGTMHADRDSSRPGATFLALRGHLTREAVGVDDTIALGDPGLLASRWIRRAPAHGHVGVVLHFSHANNEFARHLKSQLKNSVRFIDPTRSLHTVVQEISACDAILTTSLHGLVVADSFGIPGAWALPEPVLPGGVFKFNDYESVVEPVAHRRVDIREMSSPAHIRRVAAHASRTAVHHASLSLEDSLNTLHSAHTVGVATASRLWRQYDYLVPRRHGPAKADG